MQKRFVAEVTLTEVRSDSAIAFTAGLIVWGNTKHLLAVETLFSKVAILGTRDASLSKLLWSLQR